MSEPERPGSARQRRVRRVSPARSVVLAFVAAIGLGTLLLRLPLAHAPGEAHGWLTALFTATSAVCVTGLVVVDTGGAWSPFGQAVIALLIKAGGLGILSLGALVALATGRRMGFSERQRLQAQTNALSVGGIVRFVRALLLYTTSAELLGALTLWPRLARDDGLWGGAWSALFHALSAFNNAGFSLHADSLGRYAGDPWVTGVVTVGTETITKAAVLGALAAAAVGLAVTVLVHAEAAHAPHALLFEAVSAFGTVGLSLGVTADLGALARLVLVALMFTGRVGLLTVALALAATERVPSARYPIEDVVVG